MAGPAAERSSVIRGHGTLKVFLSWSGEPSHAVARALRDWLPSILPFVQPWISSKDIEKGKRGVAEIASQLNSTAFGIICVVPGNQAAPWLNFEAGALSKSVDNEGRVAPLLVQLDRGEISGGPLADFQMTVFEKEDMKRLIQDINKNAETPLDAERLNFNFNQGWPDLAAKVSEIDFPTSEAPGARARADTFLERSQEEGSILALISEFGDFELNAEKIAQRLNQSVTRAKLNLNRLVEKDMLNYILNTRTGMRYGLTDSSREFLVDAGLD